MHQVGPGSFDFEPVTNRIYRSYDLKSYPGNSGGPVCVYATNSSGQPFFIPAAIVLGGSGQTVVRAIDRDVVDLINKAEAASAAGENTTGGGVVQWQGDPSTCPPGFIPALFRIDLLPHGAIANPPGWHVGGGGNLAWIYDYTGWYYVTNPVHFTNLVIEFNTAPGFAKTGQFHNESAAGTDRSAQFRADCSDSSQLCPIAPAQLVVTPVDGLDSIGPVTGPFSPLKSYIRSPIWAART